MKKLLGIVVLGLLWCNVVQALPKCEGDDYKKWKNCYGEYSNLELDHGFTRDFKGEFGNTPGIRDGEGLSIVYENKEIYSSYEGMFENDLTNGYGFGIYYLGQFAGAKYLGEFKDGLWHGKGIFSYPGENGTNDFLSMWENGKASAPVIPYNYESTSSSYSNNKPKLYYDSRSGGMRECNHNPGPSGNCLSFKPYNPNSYTKDSLFYNSEKNAMQPCLGIISIQGKCTMYGIPNYNKIANNRDQLFYDRRNKKMTTCSFVSLSGECSHFDLVPKNSTTINDGGFRMTDPSNPYIKRVPRTSQDLIDVGMRMLTGQCTLGLNC